MNSIKPKIKLNLLENARSFIHEALHKALLAENLPINWKFAVFNIVQAIELSLKELLRLEHWVLIYRKVDNPSGFTVTVDEALERLNKISSFKLSKDEIRSLNFAQDLRNKIVHHEFEEDPKEIKLAFAKLFGFLVEFHRTKLDSNLEDYDLPSKKRTRLS